MLIETSIYQYPTKEAQMDIEPENRSWEKTPAVLKLEEIVFAHLVKEDWNPGISDPTSITFKSGDTFIIQMPYKQFIDIWKNSTENGG